MSAPIIRPQPGPQTDFLACTADIAIMGGAAGGGKSWVLLAEPLRHTVGPAANPDFGCVIFRRNATQVRNEGGLWHESHKMYGPLGATPREMSLEWTFPSKARVRFAHLEYQKTVYEWQGAQIPLIGFDELTHFEEEQFFYMLSRNRSTCGVPSYVRATTNPDADSWVRDFLAWWIDEQTGFPIPERAGKLRWFVRVDGHLIWGDTPKELRAQYPLLVPKSVTFIPSKLQDNQILMRQDPGYLANLMAQGRVERERLLDGNWNTRPTAGNIFRRSWMPIIEAMNTGVVRTIRAWDRASTVASEVNRDPDWTVGVKLVLLGTGAWVVADVVRFRGTPGDVKAAVKATALLDGPAVPIALDEEPGSAGKSEFEDWVKLLAGFQIIKTKPTKDKVTRAKPVSSQAQNGNLYLLRAPWNEQFVKECENFPDGSHDDCVDALANGFNAMTQGGGILSVL